MKQILKACLLGLLLCSCSPKAAPPPAQLWADFKARQDIKAERYEDALVRYYSLLESEPDRFGMHSNIGVLLGMIQKPEEALKSLQHALKLAEQQKDVAGIFTMQFNLGVHFGAQKKVPEALEHYQAALEIVPTSTETKTNIELLIQQQQQDQKDKQDQKKKDGQGEGDSKDQSKGDKGKDQDKKDDKGDQQKDPKDAKGDDDKKNNPDQQRENSPKYKPRPFKGDQLSEGDVKKILGELKNQEQKIRANFDKKEKGKSKNNEKDW